MIAPLAVARVAALGMPSSTIVRRARAGQWTSPFRGVVVMQSGPPSREQLIVAALPAAGGRTWSPRASSSRTTVRGA